MITLCHILNNKKDFALGKKLKLNYKESMFSKGIEPALQTHQVGITSRTLANVMVGILMIEFTPKIG